MQIVRLTNKLSMYFESRVIAFLSNCGIDQTKLSQLQATQPATTRAERLSSYGSEEASESIASNLDTSESSSGSEESEVEEKPRSQPRTGHGRAVNQRKASKQATKRTPSSEEESDYGAGAETSSAEYTDSDDKVHKQIRIKQRSRTRRRGNLHQMGARKRNKMSEDQVAVSRPRRHMAGRRLPRSEDWGGYGSYGSRPPRQAAVKARENVNVAMLDLGDDVWNEGGSTQRRGPARSRRLASWDEGEELSSEVGQQTFGSVTRHGRIVRPSTRTRMYSDN